MTEPNDILDDFLDVSRAIVWATMTTVDADGSPRSRVVHPIFVREADRPVGWIVTNRSPVKTAHLDANPRVALSWWTPAQDLAYAECTARWVDVLADKQRVFDLFMTTPPPLGYDLAASAPMTADDPRFTPLRFDPWRVQVLRFRGWEHNLTPRLWTAPGAAGSRD